MIAYRGIALSLTDALLVAVPEPIRLLGNARLGPVPADILIMVVILSACICSMPGRRSATTRGAGQRRRHCAKGWVAG